MAYGEVEYLAIGEFGGELVEVVEDGVVGGGRHAINIAYGIGLPWGKDEERARGTGSKA